MIRLYPVIFFLFTFSFSNSQTIGNMKVAHENGLIIITYNTVDELPGMKFSIKVFSSHDNYAAPLTGLMGDAGNAVVPGLKKKIVWDAKKALGEYAGELQLELHAEAIPAAWKWMSDKDNISVRRGKKANLVWQGGLPRQKVKLELVSGTRVISLAEQTNSGRYTWNVPKDFSTKDTYELRLIVDTKPVAQTALKVKPKVPLVVKLLPIMAVGAIIPFVVGGGGGGGSDTPKFPDAPLPN